MYGLETTVTMALAAGCGTHAGRPFFPQDVAAALAAMPAPRVLVTTPLHLRACLAAAVPLPPLARIVSATAPLDARLAAEAEARFSTEVHEIYGCTEAGSLATRRTAQAELWRWHPGLRAELHEGAARVHAAHLPQPLPLQDRIEIAGGDAFRLLGRAGDMVKVAGKRASLSELTAKLLAVPGVRDGVVFLPGAAADERPAALVVAPGLSRAEVLSQLSRSLDPVLLPRPLVCVERLPRNELGKLPRADLLAALEHDHDRD
jgi:acyl-coenzyme A synthetase/AMP-(fatty) acid ligase